MTRSSIRHSRQPTLLDYKSTGLRRHFQLTRLLVAMFHEIVAMKFLASSLLLGVASAAVSPQQQQQHVLQPQEQASDAWARPLDKLQDSLKSLTGEAQAVWNEVAAMFPEDMAKTGFFSHPKRHARRPDSHWDHIIKGADVQRVWVENASGGKERDVDGKLEAYNLRSKKVDPSSLGIDPGVRQYSGYLDDEEEDKHLFYCKCPMPNL